MIVFVFLEDILKIFTNICSRKLLVVAKESENIQPRKCRAQNKRG
jgi:hypothetical protein